MCLPSQSDSNRLHDFINHPHCRLRNGLDVCSASDCWFEGEPIRSVDPGQLSQLPASGLSVQSLRVTLLANCKRGIDEHLKKSADPRSHLLSCGPIRRYRRNQRNDAMIGKQPRNKTDTANILISIFF